MEQTDRAAHIRLEASRVARDGGGDASEELANIVVGNANVMSKTKTVGRRQRVTSTPCVVRRGHALLFQTCTKSINDERILKNEC